MNVATGRLWPILRVPECPLSLAPMQRSRFSARVRYCRCSNTSPFPIEHQARRLVRSTAESAACCDAAGTPLLSAPRVRRRLLGLTEGMPGPQSRPSNSRPSGAATTDSASRSPTMGLDRWLRLSLDPLAAATRSTHRVDGTSALHADGLTTAASDLDHACLALCAGRFIALPLHQRSSISDFGGTSSGL